MKREELINAFVFQWGQDGMYNETLKADVNKLINLIIATQPQQPAKELFEKVYIRSEKDLPKGKGEYFAHRESDNRLLVIDRFIDSDLEFETSVWIRNANWYLRPLE